MSSCTLHAALVRFALGRPGRRRHGGRSGSRRRACSRGDSRRSRRRPTESRLVHHLHHAVLDDRDPERDRGRDRAPARSGHGDRLPGLRRQRRHRHPDRPDPDDDRPAVRHRPPHRRVGNRARSGRRAGARGRGHRRQLGQPGQHRPAHGDGQHRSGPVGADDRPVAGRSDSAAPAQSWPSMARPASPSARRAGAEPRRSSTRIPASRSSARPTSSTTRRRR